MAMIEEYIYETVNLQPDEEYRIYLKPNEWIRIWMVYGSAEIFGTELREAKRNEKFNTPYSHRQHHSKHKKHHKSKMSIDEINSNPNEKEEMYHLRDSYLFSNTNISIYTYQGSTLYIKYQKGQCEHKFTTKDTPYQIYCNYNAALTNMRRSAEVHQVTAILNKKLSEKPSLPKIAADVIANDFSLNEHKILDLEIMKQIHCYGPRVLVLGAPNSGKASLCKILSNYALRSSYYPILVDLDCSLNMISIPGTIASLTICESIDVCTGFNHSHLIDIGHRNKMQNRMNGNRSKNGEKNEERKQNDDILTANDDISIREEVEINPIIYFYGDDHPDRRLKVYEKCVEKLSLAIKKRLILNLENRASGIIVKCHGSMNNGTDRMKLQINNIIKLFHIDTVLVIEDELTLNYLRNKYIDNIDSRNYSQYLVSTQNAKNNYDLNTYWKNRFIAIEKAVKSGGVAVREQAQRLAIGRNIIRNYFYGPNNTFRPLSCETYPCFLKIYQIGSGQTKNDLLPTDQRSVVESFGVLPVRFDDSLRGQILAVLQIENGINDKEQYEIERDINSITNRSNHHESTSNININQILINLIEYDEDNENIMYNSHTQQQISYDPFNNNNKLKNKLIRSSNVMGFVHVQEIKYDQHQRSMVAKITLLNPCQNKLPLKCLLKGHINWHDR